MSPVPEWKEGGRGRAAWCAVWNSFSLSAETFFFFFNRVALDRCFREWVSLHSSV